MSDTNVHPCFFSGKKSPDGPFRKTVGVIGNQSFFLRDDRVYTDGVKPRELPLAASVMLVLRSRVPDDMPVALPVEAAGHVFCVMALVSDVVSRVFVAVAPPLFSTVSVSSAERPAPSP